ncbi:MAG: hypothetical protein HQ517_11240, partial [SAR324 cluster bacterium]|nr:hypothetical protein [SAR324 cluster bacterium]
MKESKMKNNIITVDALGDEAVAVTFDEFSSHLSRKIPEAMWQELFISVLPSISCWGIQEEVSDWIKSQIVNDPKLNAISKNDANGLMQII